MSNKLKATAIALGAALALAACGGGGSSGGDNSNSGGSGTAKKGTAAVGAPLSYAEIEAVDLNGVYAKTKADENGKFTISSKLASPFLMKATGKAGGEDFILYAFGTSEDDGPITNINPLTNAAARTGFKNAELNPDDYIKANATRKLNTDLTEAKNILAGDAIAVMGQELEEKYTSLAQGPSAPSANPTASPPSNDGYQSKEMNANSMDENVTNPDPTDLLLEMLTVEWRDDLCVVQKDKTIPDIKKIMENFEKTEKVDLTLTKLATYTQCWKFTPKLAFTKPDKSKDESKIAAYKKALSKVPSVVKDMKDDAGKPATGADAPNDWLAPAGNGADHFGTAGTPVAKDKDDFTDADRASIQSKLESLKDVGLPLITGCDTDDSTATTAGAATLYCQASFQVTPKDVNNQPQQPQPMKVWMKYTQNAQGDANSNWKIVGKQPDGKTQPLTPPSN